MNRPEASAGILSNRGVDQRGEGETVEQYIKRVMVRIAATAYVGWERKSHP
jgi:hypothetical protein